MVVALGPCMIDSSLKLGRGDLDLFTPVAIKESFVSFLVRGVYKFKGVYKPEKEKSKRDDSVTCTKTQLSDSTSDL